MLKLKRKTYFFFVIFLSIITFLIYLFLYENNPVNNYYNNFSNTFFKLEKLKLDGRVRSNKTKILSSLSLELNSPILKINLEKIKKNILSVPWIKSAKVSRKLPNEIQDSLNELDKSKELRESFGEDVINSYLKLKNKEIDEFKRVEKFDKKSAITDLEKNNTLDC